MISISLKLVIVPLILGVFLTPLTVHDQPERKERKEMFSSAVKRVESHQNYTLSPGVTVELRHVPFGSIVIEPTDTNEAEVHIVRSAQTSEELDCNRIVIENSPSRLLFRGNENQDCKLRNTSIEQSVILKLPRFVNITADTITGPLRIGEAEGRGPDFIKGPDGNKVAQPVDRPSIVGRGFDGAITIHSISGPIKLVQGSGETNISGVNGGVSISIRRFGNGVSVDGINGAIDLQLAQDVNANLEVSNIRGEVNNQGTVVQVIPHSKDSYQAQIGAGGGPISISNIIGNVVLRRGQN